MTRVVVHIDRLVLRGVRPEDRLAVANAFRAELSRVLADARSVAVLARSPNVPSLRAGSVHVAANASRKQIGSAAARGIGRVLGR